MHGLDQRLWRTVEDPVVQGEGPGARMLAANLAREAASDGTGRARAVELARFAVADGVLQTAGEEMLWYTAGIVLHLADEEVGEMWDAAVARAVERGSLFSVLATHLWRGFTQWNHGDLRAARRSLETAVGQSQTWGLAPGAPQGRTFLTAVLLDLGDTVGARACLERMRGWVRGAEGQRLLGESEARVLNAEERFEEALAALDGVGPLQPALANPAWWPWSLLRARSLAGVGRRAEALALAGEHLRVAREWGAPSTLGRVLRIVGQLRGPEGEPQLREAVALLAHGPARLEYARALHALVEYAPRGEAGSLLSRARSIARECGANYLTRTRTGKPVKSSTIVLRDSTGAVFGALCVNVDIGPVNEAHALLGALAGLGPAPAEAPVTTFGNDIDSVVDAILDGHRLGQNQSWAAMDRDERLQLFRGLDGQGVFAVRRAVERVATRLGISRASAYSYLAQARAATDPTTAGGHA